jgi:hypothetical protein
MEGGEERKLRSGKKKEKMERDEKEKIGVEKGKWGKRGLSKLVLRQNAEDR